MENDPMFSEASLTAQLLLAETELRIANAALSETRETKKTIGECIQTDKNETAARIRQLQIELMERTSKLQQEYDALEQERLKQQREAWKKQEEVESLQRQIDAARRANIKKNEWSTLENRWDQLTMGAPWREWAKDHQLQAAKKITYEGRMILGDTMGLGKTLSVICALDMIEAATKDASPDNPIKFGADV